MGEAPKLKNIQFTYALIEKEEFRKPVLNYLLLNFDGGKYITLSPTPLLKFDIGTDKETKNIGLLSDEEILKASIPDGKFEKKTYNPTSTHDLDLLKAISYAQRQKQEVFLSQKDESFPPIGFTDPNYEGPSKAVFVFDWLSDVCDDRPDLFIGGLFEDSKQFRLGVFSLLNVRLVYDEPDLHYLSTVLKIKNAKYVMNFEKKKVPRPFLIFLYFKFVYLQVFGEDFLVNVPNSIEVQPKKGKKMEITRV